MEIYILSPFENNYSVIESWGVVIADKIWDEGDIFPIWLLLSTEPPFIILLVHFSFFSKLFDHHHALLYKIVSHIFPVKFSHYFEQFVPIFIRNKIFSENNPFQWLWKVCIALLKANSQKSGFSRRAVIWIKSKWFPSVRQLQHTFFLPQNKISKWGLDGVSGWEGLPLGLALSLPYFFHCVLPAQKLKSHFFSQKYQTSYFKKSFIPLIFIWLRREWEKNGHF